MASIQKVAKGYRAQVKTLGVRDSAVFLPSARQWLRTMQTSQQASCTVCARRFVVMLKEVSPH